MKKVSFTFVYKQRDYWFECVKTKNSMKHYIGEILKREDLQKVIAKSKPHEDYYMVEE